MTRESWETVANAYAFSGTETGTELAKLTLTAISPGGETAGKAFAIPANFLQVGHMIRITAGGVFGIAEAINEVELTPWFIPGAKVLSEGKRLLPTAQVTFKIEKPVRKKVGWCWESLSRVKVAGASGTLMTTGKLIVATAGKTPGAAYAIPTAESTALGESEAWPLNEEGRLVFGCKFTTESAEDNIQQTIWAVEILN